MDRERRSYKWAEDLRSGGRGERRGRTGPTAGSIGVIAGEDAKR